MKDRYFEYLVDFGGLEEHRGLAGYLHTRPFEWTLEMDENRMYDGLAMRREFRCWSTGKRFNFGPYQEDLSLYSKLEGNACTLLEFFTGFAHRIDRDMLCMDDQGEDGAKVWLRILLENLGLWRFDGELTDKDKDAIDDYIYRWVNLDYDRFCNGGLFPVKNIKKDMRKVDMWVQASWWANENL
jgi:hypothetical protein